MENEIYPGVNIEIDNTISEEEELRLSIIAEKIRTEEEIAQRKKAILMQVKNNIAHGEYTEITEEMKLLGLAEEINSMLQTGMFFHQFNSLLFDEDEVELSKPSDWF